MGMQFKKMRKLRLLIIFLIITSCMHSSMCTLVTMRVYHSSTYIAMDEAMFLRLYTCMDDRYTQQCILNLRRMSSTYFVVNDVYKVSSSTALSSVFVCVYEDYSYTYYRYIASCKRNSSQKCQDCSKDSAFSILWDSWYQSFNDTYHQLCPSNWYCKMYGKLTTTTSTTRTSPTTSTTTSAETAETTTTTTTHSESDVTSTWMTHSDTSYFSIYLTQPQTEFSDTQNVTTIPGLHQNINVENIIIGSVVGVVLAFIAAVVIFFVWKKRRIERGKNHRLNMDKDFKLKPIKQINKTIADTSSDNHDQYAVANISQENHFNNMSSDSLPYSIARDVRPSGDNNVCNSTNLNDKYSNNFNQQTVTNTSLAKDGDVISRHSSPYLNSENIPPNTDPISQSDQINNVYQNISDRQTVVDSIDYARLGQNLKVFNNDYNGFIPVQEDKNSKRIRDEVIVGSSSEAPVYLMAQQIQIISPNQPTDIYSMVHKV